MEHLIFTSPRLSRPALGPTQPPRNCLPALCPEVKTAGALRRPSATIWRPRLRMSTVKRLVPPHRPKETPMARHGAIFIFSMEYFGLSANLLKASPSCISYWQEKNKIQRYSPFSFSSFIAFFIKQHTNICHEHYLLTYLLHGAESFLRS